MTPSRLLEQIHAAQNCAIPGCRCGKPGMTHCPAHADEHPSLSLRLAEGKVLFNCQAGCSQDDVLAELRDRGLWPENGGTPPKRTIVRTYDYLGPVGGLVFQVVRYEPKTFRQRRPDGNGGWIWNMDGVKPILYHLPEILAASADQPVIMVEGERDVETAEALGLISTCTPMGAGKASKCDLSPLRGRGVLIIADDDEPGRKHAADLERPLRPRASSIKRLTLPAHDLTDFVQAGHGLADVQGLIDAAEPITARADFGLRLARLADVKREEVRWRWLHRIPEGKLTLLEGDPGEGKSFLTLAFATAITLGIALPGDVGEFEPRDILLFSAEDGKADTIRPRLEDMGADLTRVYVVDGCIGEDGEKRWPNLKDDIGYIEAVLTSGRFGLVVLDPINAYLGDTDANQDTKIRGILGPLSELADRYNTIMLPLRHLKKTATDKAIYRGLGSIGYTGAARSVLLAGRNPDDESERLVICVKHNLAPDSPAIAYEIDYAGRFMWKGESSLTQEQILTPKPQEQQRTKLDEAIAFLEEVMADGEDHLSDDLINEAKSELNIGRNAMFDAKKALGIEAHREHIEGAGRGKGKWYWRFKRLSVPYINAKRLNDDEVREPESHMALWHSESGIHPGLCPGGCGKQTAFGMICTACLMEQNKQRHDV